MSNQNRIIALAIGGLAGSNAHGAGCLQALLDKELALNKAGKPFPVKIISCTTGQIFWVYSYLKARQPGQRDIRMRFDEYHQAEAPFFNLVHSLYRFFWHDAPLAKLCWGFSQILVPATVETLLKLAVKQALSSYWVPANRLWFDTVAPTFRGWPIYLLMHERDYILATRTLFGVPDRYFIPFNSYIRDVFQNWLTALFRLVYHDEQNVFLTKELTDCIPGRFIEPVFLQDHNWLDKVYQEIDGASIAILFNAFDPRNGLEYVYLNQQARKTLNIPLRSKAGKAGGYRERVVYDALSATAVQDALWLWYYGFDQTKVTSVKVDGAYFRDVILSELQDADRIFVARPIHHQWIGPYPKTFIGIRDMETEVLFNGAYQGERDKICLINKLVEDNKPNPLVLGTPPKTFKHIDLEEVEINSQRGFYDYLFEDMQVFNDAVKRFVIAFDF